MNKNTRKESETLKNKIRVLLIDEVLITVVASLVSICIGVDVCILIYWLVVGLAFFLECLIAYVMIRTGDSHKREKSYYRKTYNYENKIKTWKADGGFFHNFFSNFIIPVMIEVGIFFIIFVFICRNQLIDILMQYKTSTPTELSGNIVSIGIAAYGVILTMLTIVGTYFKQKSFLFEVDQNKMIKQSIVWLFISLLILCVFGVVQFVNSELTVILEIILSRIWLVSILIPIVFLFYTLIVIYKQTYEKKILRDMFKLYWCEKIVITPNKTWYKSNMLEGLGILFSDFVKISKKIAKKKIRSVKFRSVYEDNVVNRKIAKREIFRMVWGLITFAPEIFVPLAVCVTNHEEMSILCIFYWVQIFIPAIYFFLYIGNSNMNILYLNYFKTNLWGYYFEKRNVEIYIHRHVPPNKVYTKYINCIKNIIAFFNLAKSMRYEDLDNCEVEKYYIDCMIETFRNNLLNTWNDKKDDMVYASIPIVICGCLLESGNDKGEAQIRSLFNDIHFCDIECEFIENISLCILRDFVGNDKEFYNREEEYKNKLMIFMKQKTGKKKESY